MCNSHSELNRLNKRRHLKCEISFNLIRFQYYLKNVFLQSDLEVGLHSCCSSWIFLDKTLPNNEVEKSRIWLNLFLFSMKSNSDKKQQSDQWKATESHAVHWNPIHFQELNRNMVQMTALLPHIAHSYCIHCVPLI